MRDIPPSLLEKIKESHQTIYQNADPKLDIQFLGAEGDYLTSLERFFAITIQKGQILGRIDAASARPDPQHLPTHLTIVYLVDDHAYAATTPLPVHPRSKWNVIGGFGPAIDVSIEFLGYWTRRIRSQEQFTDPRNSRWSIVTVGDPWYFVTRPDGTLDARQGLSGDWITLEVGVTRIDALAGWKGQYKPEDDQGLVLAYLKEGRVYYRNLAEQADHQIFWEQARIITELPSNCVNVALFRTNDYRMGFLVETMDGMIHWAITVRCWSGMGIDDHFLSASLNNIQLEVHPIVYTDATFPAEYLVAGLQSLEVQVCPAIWPTFVGVATSRFQPTQLTLTFSLPLTLGAGLLASAFTVRDSVNTNFPVLTAVLSDTTITLTTPNYEGMQTNLTVTYTYATAPLNYINPVGGCLMALASFSHTFVPDITPPLLWGTPDTLTAALSHISVTVTPLVYSTAVHAPETLTAALHSISIVVTKVGGLDP